MSEFSKKRKSIYKAFFIIFFLLVSSSGFAFQDCNDDPLNPNPDFPDCDPFLDVPIDDGVYFIIAAGILIGYKLFDKNKLASPAN